MVPWTCTDTRAARGSCDPDIAADQAHLPAPIELVEFGGGRRRWFDDNLRDFGGHCCCGCCWSVAFGFVGSVTHVSLAPAGSIYITAKPGMGTPVPSPAVPKHWVVELQASSVCGGFCPVKIPMGASI